MASDGRGSHQRVLSTEERTRALRQEMNYMVAHMLHRHSKSLVKELERVAHRIVQEVIKN